MRAVVGHGEADACEWCACPLLTGDVAEFRDNAQVVGWFCGTGCASGAERHALAMIEAEEIDPESLEAAGDFFDALTTGRVYA